MNKITNILWGLILVLPMWIAFSGCKKLLDRKPLSATLDDLNQGGLEGQIYGLYGAIRNGDVAGQAFGGIPWLAIHGFRADDSEKGSSNSDGADWGVIFDGFQYVPDHWSSTIYWDQHYVLIGMANTALQTADSLGLNSPADMINQAEARFFRAFAYFDLVRTYGQVPKIDFRIYNATDAKQPKSDTAVIYGLIDQDLQFAMTHLPPNWLNPSGGNRFPGRLTFYAAKALYAKTLLYRRQWGTAFTQLQEIIGSGVYGLYDDYFKLFTEEGENSKESLFEIQAYIGPNGTNNLYSWYGIAQGVRGAGDWDLGWGWNTPMQELVDSYETDDPRKNSTILFSGQPDGVYGKELPPYPTIPRQFWNKKVYPEPAMQALTANRQGGWINQREIRYADVLLMAAEAANEKTPNDGALAASYVNEVRARARGGAAVLPDVTYTDQATMRAIIKQERRSELAMEGERFFDLVRWGDAVSVLGSLGYQHKNRYYPLPQAAIDFSGGLLIQNPDY